MRTLLQKLTLSVLSVLIIFGLSGCFKGEISVDVKESGKGFVGVAFGMTQEAKALLSIQSDNSGSQPTNPFDQIQKELAENVGLPGDIKVSTWIDDDYEWFKAEKGFNNLDEINQLVADIEMFKSFKLTRKTGFLQNEFILEGELNSLSDDPMSGEMQIDPSMFIQMQFSLRLPGRIVETNGLVDVNDPNKMTWRAQGSKPVSMKARSLAWNWVNIGILAGVGGLILLIGIGVIGFTFFKRTSGPNLAPAQQKSVNNQQPFLETDDQLANLGVADLLRQVNERALNNSGEFYNKLGVIMLTWKDATGRQKFIEVKDLGLQKISINGQVFPATKENAKAGILGALKE